MRLTSATRTSSVRYSQRSRPLGLLRRVSLTFFLLLLTTVATAQQANQLPNMVAMQSSIPPGTYLSMTGSITKDGVSGTISLKATRNGQTQIQVALPSGSETETRLISPLWRTGIWTDSTGASHQVPAQDLVGPHPAWFFPTFVLMSGLGSPDYLSSNLGIETRNGISVEHIAVWQRPINSLPASSAAYVQQQTQYDIYLDPSTSLPVAMTFTRQFDSAASSQFLAPAQTSSAGVLEEVRYSNYQQVQAVPIAFHLQVFFQGALHQEIQISSAKFSPSPGSVEAQ
jgi:hypothetical protein